MDNRLLLVKCITLLYRESLITDSSENSSDLVRTSLETIKLGEVQITINRERDTIIALRQTTIEMCENPIGFIYDKDDLLQRLRLNCGDDDSLYEIISSGIEPELTLGRLKQTIVNIRHAITNHSKEVKIDAVLTKAAAHFRHSRDKIKNVSTFIADLLTELEPFQLNTTARDPAVMTEVDIGDKNAIAKIFEGVKARGAGDLIYRLGKQELNNMLQGGLRRGDCVLVSALPHNFKTGMTLDMFKGLALYNKPKMLDPTKKPLLLRISFEDDTEVNIQWMYQSLKENETGQKVILGADGNVSGISDDEMAVYVKERLQVNGFEIKLMRVDPSKWTYLNVINKIMEYEASGYEVQVVGIDYLALLPTTGCTVGPMGSDVRDLFRRIRNFCSSRRIIVVSPHQLSPAAKQMFREGRHDFVKQLPGKGYYDRCSTIDNEVDIELFIHIEQLFGKSYLTVQRGKHRGAPGIITEEQKFCSFEFNDIGGIRDDLHTHNTASRKTGGKPIGVVDKTEEEWFF